MAIPTRIDVVACKDTRPALYTGGGIRYVVETPTGVLYNFIIDINADPAFIKSVDYGLTWSSPVVLKNIACTQLSVWYQRWTDPTGVLGDKIWSCYTDSVSDDVFIRSVDTANSDALGTEYVVFAGGSTADAGALSICQMRGGNLLAVGMIDAFTEPFCRRSTDSGATWADRTAVMEAAADQIICMPGWGGVGDENDAMCFYYDNDATEVSVKYYDDSANSWSEAALGTAVFPGITATLGHWSATVDHTNSTNLIAFWSAIDAANADLRVFSCSQSAQTETAANVVLNSTKDQGFCGISITGSSWMIFYCGFSDGTDVFSSNLSLQYKTTADGGGSWSSETQLGISFMRTNLITIPITYKTWGVCTLNVSSTTNVWHIYNAPLAIPRATFQLGM